MAESKLNKRGVALLLALGIVLVVCVLASIILTIMSSQNKLTNHQVNRIRAYYAAQACLNYTIEMIKDGTYIPDSPLGGTTYYACMNGCIDQSVTYTIPPDPYILNKVQVTIFPWQNSGSFSGTVKLEAKVEYSYVYPPG